VEIVGSYMKNYKKFLDPNAQLRQNVLDSKLENYNVELEERIKSCCLQA
jgi:hypothetical protein